MKPNPLGRTHVSAMKMTPMMNDDESNPSPKKVPGIDHCLQAMAERAKNHLARCKESLGQLEKDRESECTNSVCTNAEEAMLRNAHEEALEWVENVRTRIDDMRRVQVHPEKKRPKMDERQKISVLQEQLKKLQNVVEEKAMRVHHKAQSVLEQNNSKLETCQQFLDKLKSKLENGDTIRKKVTNLKDTDDTVGGKQSVEEIIRARNLHLMSSSRRDTAFAKSSHHPQINLLCTKRHQSIVRNRIASIDVMDMVAPFKNIEDIEGISEIMELVLRIFMRRETHHVVNLINFLNHEALPGSSIATEDDLSAYNSHLQTIYGEVGKNTKVEKFLLYACWCIRAVVVRASLDKTKRREVKSGLCNAATCLMSMLENNDYKYKLEEKEKGYKNPQRIKNKRPRLSAGDSPLAYPQKRSKCTPTEDSDDSASESGKSSGSNDSEDSEDEFERRTPPKKEPNTSQEPKKTPKGSLSKATADMRAAVQKKMGTNTTSVFGIGVGR
jgi:hypothetical protein